MKQKSSQIRFLERSVYKSRRDNMLASQYQERKAVLQKQEKTIQNVDCDLDELFDLLSKENDQLDIIDLIGYMNSLGHQYRNSILLKILRIYQVSFSIKPFLSIH